MNSVLSKSQGTTLDFFSEDDSNAFESRVIIPGENILNDCFHLRYRYFVEERAWTSGDDEDDLCESDQYDAFATHLGIIEGGRILAYMRMVPWPYVFMLDNEFRCLVPDKYPQTRANSAELSRLVVTPDLSREESFTILELLFKLFYQTALQQGLEHFYIVTEKCWLRVCRRHFGLGFSELGSAQTFPDGTRTVAAYASMQTLESAMIQHSPAKFAWYRQK